MALDDFLRRERRLLIAAGAVGARTLDVMVLKLGMLRMIDSAAPGSVIDAEVIRELLDDLELPISFREAVDILEEAGLLVRTGTEHAVPDSYDSDRWFVHGAGGLLGAVSREEIDVALDPADAIGATLPSLQTIAEVLARNGRWALAIAAEADARGLAGLPVFWDCLDERHVPFSDDPGSMATTDAALLCAERVYYGIPLGSLGDSQEAALTWLWERILDLQVHEPVWDVGAFALPAWDDDFVGTFDPAIDRGGSCPTVDATANAVLALCALLQTRPTSALAATSVRAIEEGVRCLLRWQASDGGWAIYRYPPGSPKGWSLHSRDMSSRYALEALARASRIVADEPHPLVNAARRFGDFVLDQLQWDGQLCFWGGDVDGRRDDEGARLRATAMIAPTLDMVRPLLDGNVIDAVELGVLAYFEAVWSPDPDRYVPVRFRVPTREGPGDPATWELPADPAVVSAVLGSASARRSLGPALVQKVQHAVGAFLAYELHGHWADFLMRNEGKVRGMTGNTRHYHRALADYVAWQATLLPTDARPGLPSFALPQT